MALPSLVRTSTTTGVGLGALSATPKVWSAPSGTGVESAIESRGVSSTGVTVSDTVAMSDTLLPSRARKRERVEAVVVGGRAGR